MFSGSKQSKTAVQTTTPFTFLHATSKFPVQFFDDVFVIRFVNSGTKWDVSSGVSQFVDFSADFDFTKWHFAGFVYESSTNRMMFYLDGELVAEKLFPVTIDWENQAAGGYFIGQHSAECTDPRLFEFDIFCNQWYNRVLSPSEVKSAMRCPWANFPRPVAYILMDDTSGVSDVSGNIYDASPSNVASNGQDYTFNGATSKVALPASVSWNNWPYAPLSVFLHLQIDTAPVEFIRLKDVSSGVVYWRATINGTHCQFQLRTSSGSYSTVSFADVPALMDNSIRYRGFTWDPLTRTLKYFLESVEMGSVIIADDLDVATTDSKIILGAFWGKAAALQVFHATVSLKHSTLLGTWPMTATKAASVYSMNTVYKCGVGSKTGNLDSVSLSSSAFLPISGNVANSGGPSIKDVDMQYYEFSQCSGATEGLEMTLSTNAKPSSSESFTISVWFYWLSIDNIGANRRQLIVYNSATQNVGFLLTFFISFCIVYF